MPNGIVGKGIAKLGPSQSKNPQRFKDLAYLKSLLAAGARASSLEVAVLDSETRFEVVNAPLARETRVGIEEHIGKTSREIVGDLAKQIEPTFEAVLRTRQPASILLTGHVRDTPEFGYWLDYCFPVPNQSTRVQQLGLFVVNITAEETAIEMFDSLPGDSKCQLAEANGLLNRFEESIALYHLFLKARFEELANPAISTARKVDRFRSFIGQLDHEISGMRELIYEVISRFSIPRC
jgi:hypothetical protein